MMQKLPVQVVVSAMALSLIISAAYAQDAGSSVAGSAGVEVNSAYIFRGATNNDEVNVSPTIEASSEGLTVGAWGNFDTDLEEFTEIDLYVSYDLALDLPVDVSVGYTEYTYPTAGAPEDGGAAADRELNAVLSQEGALSPSLFVGVGVDGPSLDEGLYLELSGSHDITCPITDLPIGLGAAVGYQAGDNFAENGFSHVLVTAGTTVGPLDISVGYVIETDDEVLMVDEDVVISASASL